MLSEHAAEMIRNFQGEMKKPVRLVFFSTDTGCEACPGMLEIIREIKARFGKMIALETYDVVMDRDKSEQYAVSFAPAVIAQSGEGHYVAFFGMVEDIFLGVLLKTIHAMSETKPWFPDDVRRALSHLVNEVRVRVFVEADCDECRPVAETAVGLALENSLVRTGIIVASDFPDLIKKYGIKTLPKTIFGENLHLDGHVSESEFLEMIFQSEGLKTGPDKKCIVCGSPSPDVICTKCRTKIQAEAVDHKFRGEKLGHPDSL